MTFCILFKILFLFMQRLTRNLKWICAIVYIQQNEKKRKLDILLPGTFCFPYCVFENWQAFWYRYTPWYFFRKEGNETIYNQIFFSSCILLYQNYKIRFHFIVHLKCWQLITCVEDVCWSVICLWELLYHFLFGLTVS